MVLSAGPNIIGLTLSIPYSLNISRVKIFVDSWLSVAFSVFVINISRIAKT